MAHQRTDQKRQGLAAGLLSGTRLAAAVGWHAVETLSPGDRLLTFRNGLQALVAVLPGQHTAAEVPRSLWPVHVPAGALGCRNDLWLLPGQTLLVETDAAGQAPGTTMALVPAAALVGWRGISRRRPEAGPGLFRLVFAQPQIVYASRAVLLACDGEAGCWLDTPLSAVPVLALPEAEHLIRCLMAAEIGAALLSGNRAAPRA